MTNKAEIRVDGNTIRLTGDLDFSNVMPLYRQSQALFQQSASSVRVDFSGLNSANSVVLALIVSWIRLARQQAKTIQLINISQDIMSLASASGLDKVFLPLALNQ
jgi:anti-anti-sigma factor